MFVAFIMVKRSSAARCASYAVSNTYLPVDVAAT